MRCIYNQRDDVRVGPEQSTQDSGAPDQAGGGRAGAPEGSNSHLLTGCRGGTSRRVLWRNQRGALARSDRDGAPRLFTRRDGL